MDNKEIFKIAEHYRDTEDPNEHINYWNFLADLNLTNQPYNPDVLVPVIFTNNVDASGTFNGGLTDVLRKIARNCKDQSVRPKLFFEDYDRLRKGVVHPSKFITALDNLKVHLSNTEIQMLKDK